METTNVVSGKEPWLAVILSTLFPGVGQIYAGKTQRGLILIFLGLGLLILGFVFIFDPIGSALLGFQLLIA